MVKLWFPLCIYEVQSLPGFAYWITAKHPSLIQVGMCFFWICPFSVRLPCGIVKKKKVRNKYVILLFSSKQVNIFLERNPHFPLPPSKELPAFAVTWKCAYYWLNQQWVWARFAEFSPAVWSSTVFIFAFDTVLLQQDLKVIPSGGVYNCLLLGGSWDFQTQFNCKSLKADSRPACAWKEDRQMKAVAFSELVLHERDGETFLVAELAVISSTWLKMARHGDCEFIRKGWVKAPDTWW